MRRSKNAAALRRLAARGDCGRSLAADGMARRLVLDGLTALDANGLASPALAVEWQSDSSDHRWQFRLRQGVHFHDGSPLNATAVVMALNTACSANCPWTAVRAVGSEVIFTERLADAEFARVARERCVSHRADAHGRRANAGQSHRYRAVSVHKFEQRRAHADRQRKLLAGTTVC